MQHIERLPWALGVFSNVAWHGGKGVRLLAPGPGDIGQKRRYVRLLAPGSEEIGQKWRNGFVGEPVGSGPGGHRSKKFKKTRGREAFGSRPGGHRSKKIHALNKNRTSVMDGDGWRMGNISDKALPFGNQSFFELLAMTEPDIPLTDLNLRIFALVLVFLASILGIGPTSMGYLASVTENGEYSDSLYILRAFTAGYHSQ
jgi:hypothetical protein